MEDFVLRENTDYKRKGFDPRIFLIERALAFFGDETLSRDIQPLIDEIYANVGRDTARVAIERFNNSSEIRGKRTRLEKELQQWLSYGERLSRIEPGLTFITAEGRAGEGCIDILAEKGGKEVAIELKMPKSGRIIRSDIPGILSQCNKYLLELPDSELYFASPDIHPAIFESLSKEHPERVRFFKITDITPGESYSFEPFTAIPEEDTRPREIPCEDIEAPPRIRIGKNGCGTKRNRKKIVDPKDIREENLESTPCADSESGSESHPLFYRALLLTRPDLSEDEKQRYLRGIEVSREKKKELEELRRYPHALSLSREYNQFKKNFIPVEEWKLLDLDNLELGRAIPCNLLDREAIKRACDKLKSAKSSFNHFCRSLEQVGDRKELNEATQADKGYFYDTVGRFNSMINRFLSNREAIRAKRVLRSAFKKTTLRKDKETISYLLFFLNLFDERMQEASMISRLDRANCLSDVDPLFSRLVLLDEGYLSLERQVALDPTSKCLHTSSADSYSRLLRKMDKLYSSILDDCLRVRAEEEPGHVEIIKTSQVRVAPNAEPESVPPVRVEAVETNGAPKSEKNIYEGAVQKVIKSRQGGFTEGAMLRLRYLFEEDVREEDVDKFAESLVQMNLGRLMHRNSLNDTQFYAFLDGAMLDYRKKGNVPSKEELTRRYEEVRKTKKQGKKS